MITYLKKALDEMTIREAKLIKKINEDNATLKEMSYVIEMLETHIEDAKRKGETNESKI